jgi:hypothetical protein
MNGRLPWPTEKSSGEYWVFLALGLAHRPDGAARGLAARTKANSGYSEFSLRRHARSEVSRLNDRMRPQRVVVVDADNPLQEIAGEFFWREDHERILAHTRETAYAAGFADATAAAQQHILRISRRRRGGAVRRAVFYLLLALIVLAFVVSLIGEMLSSAHNS